MKAVALKEDGFGKLEHKRELSPIDSQNVIRQNRDTLYSAAVFDLDAGPVTITLPDSGKRFMSLQVISEDQYSPPAVYAPATATLTREGVGTRYVLVGVRTLVDPNKPGDLDEAHVLQDGLKVDQPGGPGKFETPDWDQASQTKIREALITLATTLTDTSRSFGLKDEVDPVQRLISAAATWGGNPPKDAVYFDCHAAEQRRRDDLQAARGRRACRRLLVDQPLQRQGLFRKERPRLVLARTTSPALRTLTARPTSSSAAATAACPIAW